MQPIKSIQFADKKLLLDFFNIINEEDTSNIPQELIKFFNGLIDQPYFEIGHNGLINHVDCLIVFILNLKLQQPIILLIIHFYDLLS